EDLEYEVTGEDVDAGSREHYQDAALYDYEYRRRRADLRFYRELALELLGGPGPILDLACGSGRLTVGLLRDGHTVLGIDLSPAMVARCRERLEKLGRAARARGSVEVGDARTFEVASRFPLIVMAFNSLEHLYTRTEVAACFQRVRDHLTPDGRFVFDVQNPNLRWLARDPRRRWARSKFRHPTTGDLLEYSTSHVYDPISQIVVIRFFYQHIGADSPVVEVRLSQRKFFPAELEALVACNGLRVVDRFGDFSGAELHGDAESQTLVCARA
ncbi:MAG TPA: methyltransferase domain-containing protein, partial [Kofleriaceae bacterium]|nr:methyltransferase domain-containing protein [Kofleriaceae bacterium]